jgi:outer membrane protein TolC
MSKLFLVQCFMLPIALLASQFACASDSLKVFTIKDYLQLVTANHPIVRQAALLSEQAQMNVRMAKGAFDPKLTSNYYDKFYGNNQYYSVWQSELSIPVYVGDVKVGYQENQGQYLNPENYTSNKGLASVGYVIPLGNGLLTDERRTMLRQAQVMQESTEAERVKMINKFLLQSVKDYWDWYFAFNQYQLNKESLDLVRFRLEAIRSRVEEGDLPSIDSIEARIQEQWIFQAYQQAQLTFQNSTINLANSLWDGAGNPLPAFHLMPVDSFLEIKSIMPDSLDRLIMYAKENHPEIIKAEMKVQYNVLDRKLATEKLRPQIDIGAYWLQGGFFEQGNVNRNNYLSDNHMLKANFSYPLFLRKERAKFRLAKIKTQYAQMDLQMTNRDVENQLQTQYNELKTYQAQLFTQALLVENLTKLREGEQTRYLIGESTLFVLNQRDQYVLKEKIKYREIKAKFAKSLVSLQWAAGRVQF